MDVVEQVLADVPDPGERFRVLTCAEAYAMALANRFAVERGKICAQLHDAGESYGQIGRRLHISRARVHQLAARARALGF